ncbi:MAG: carboxy-S-adenosyl-L-methionine synthase CmoA [Gammaproteobacteria bacterium]|nr:MAG: carboxy-S-adenosyl-L-methionine synthase CmoA [Gammaproteobacteria bacterium]
MNPDRRDTLYQADSLVSPFEFNEEVARVFDDMIRRSVPGYGLTLDMISLMARRYSQKGSLCMDLGCSLGGSTLALARGVKNDTTIIAVDNAPPMLEQAQSLFHDHDSHVPIQFVCADVRSLTYTNISFAVLNFTLQFIPVSQKTSFLKELYRGLLPEGALLLSEKIRFEPEAIDTLQVSLHHDFKRFMGYSDLEISRKRNALEKVLLPDTLDTHRNRLRESGFSEVLVWFQCFNFVSLLALK